MHELRARLPLPAPQTSRKARVELLSGGWKHSPQREVNTNTHTRNPHKKPAQHYRKKITPLCSDSLALVAILPVTISAKN